jgi:hypothetical protein
VLIWLHLAPDELIARMTRRGAVRDSAKTADPAAFLAATRSGPPQVPHIAVDASLPLAQMVRIAVVAIDGTA